MKYVICIVLLVLTTDHLLAQKSIAKTIKNTTFYKYQEVYKWEAYTSKGVTVFGVCKSRELAEAAVADFTRRNWNSTARPLHPLIVKDLATTQNYFQTFASYCPSGYRVLSTTDLTALRIIEIANIDEAATYYDKYSKKKNYGQSMLYLSNLYNNFKPYRIQ